MIKRYKKPRGVTLVELLIYLGISSIVTLAMSAFLVTTVHQRTEVASQNAAQHETRRVLEQLTYGLRNAYSVDVRTGGSAVDVYSDSTEPQVATYELSGDRLNFGQQATTPPPAETLQPITGTDMKVTEVRFTRVASSLQVHLVIMKGTHQSTINSTISFRQL